MRVCVIPFIKRAERGRHTPHNYESTPVDPLRHVGIVSSTEAPKLTTKGRSPQRTAVGREAREEGGPKSWARDMHVNGRVELTHVRGAG